MVAHHVHHAHLRHGCCKEVGTLVDGSTHEESAIRASVASQVLWRSVFFFDKPLGCGDEVVEDVLLLHLCAGFVPLLAILRAAAQVSHGIDATCFEERNDAGVERRGEADVEAPVAIEQGGVLAVLGDALLVGEEHTHLGAVLAGVGHLLGDEILRLELQLGLLHEARRAVGKIEAVD